MIPEVDDDGNPPYYEFKNFHKQLMIPIVICFDFESILKTILSEAVCGSSKGSYTQKYQHHYASGFAMTFKSICEDVFKPELYQYTADSESVDVTQIFIDMLENVVKRIWNRVDFNKDFDGETPEEYHTATHCHICEKELNGDKVRDDCHFTRKYRGAAHKACNFSFKIPNLISMFCHNLSGYNGHLFIRYLANRPGWSTFISINSEKCISFSKKITVGTYINKKDGQIKEKKVDIRFLDSMRFMNHSLAKLVSYLPQELFEVLKTFIPKEEQWKLLLQKGAFPYDWFDS